MIKEKKQLRKHFYFSQMFLKFFLKRGKIKNADMNLKNLFEILFQKTSLGQYSILTKIYKVLYINFEIRKIKKYRSSYLVPIPIARKRRYFLILKWLFDSIERDKKRISFVAKLSIEILKYLQDQDSEGKKKKRLTKKLALENRSNAHYRWY